jgi:hypothetical protein
MPMKKTIGAIVAAILTIVLGRYIIHGLWLASDYRAGVGTWRTPEAMMHRVYLLQLSALCIAIAAVLTYVRGVELKPWPGQGIRFGILLALLTAIPNSLVQYSVYPIHHIVALKWIIGESLLAIVLGLVIAAICQPTKAAGA